MLKYFELDKVASLQYVQNALLKAEITPPDCPLLEISDRKPFLNLTEIYAYYNIKGSGCKPTKEAIKAFLNVVSA